ncbi:PAS domain-containing protein [Arenibaculum pallidiluteum]|uniref:PAS domain-containing protein n=1 Tax=Arenibaculum pallidiluteum TaxID=2812559 RepID=UPI001A95FAFE|nr:PAS domain-containing protein [Arenibaculum pallidiluteum]
MSALVRFREGKFHRDASVASPRMEQAWAYWQRIRGDRRFPLRSDFDPTEIPELLPSSAMVEVLRDPLDFRFRLVGTAIDAITTRSIVGKRFSEIAYLTPGNNGWAEYESVATTGEPLLVDRAYVGESSLVLALRDSLFPLSTDGEVVDRVWSYLDIASAPMPGRPLPRIQG